MVPVALPEDRLVEAHQPRVVEPLLGDEPLDRLRVARTPGREHIGEDPAHLLAGLRQALGEDQFLDAGIVAEQGVDLLLAPSRGRPPAGCPHARASSRCRSIPWSGSSPARCISIIAQHHGRHRRLESLEHRQRQALRREMRRQRLPGLGAEVVAQRLAGRVRPLLHRQQRRLRRLRRVGEVDLAGEGVGRREGGLDTRVQRIEVLRAHVHAAEQPDLGVAAAWRARGRAAAPRRCRRPGARRRSEPRFQGLLTCSSSGTCRSPSPST